MTMDMVFTYVNGADPAHVAKRNAIGAVSGHRMQSPASAHDIWYNDVGEIVFSVRSVLKNMPWIGTIFIVTDEQVPPVDRELLDSGRVQVIDHREIIPAEFRPAFASTIIESFLHRIPGLSEIYLYNNDDFMHGSPIVPDEFRYMLPDGSQRLRLRTAPAILRHLIRTLSDWSPRALPRANPYTAGISNAGSLLHHRCGLPWSSIVSPRHVTQTYRISTAKRIETVLAAELQAARERHIRSHGQLSWGTLAYSLECHWNGAERRPHRPVIAGTAADELFLDFNRYAGPRQMTAAWNRVRASRAKFICLNNIPASEKATFHNVMAAKGLADPL